MTDDKPATAPAEPATDATAATAEATEVAGVAAETGEPGETGETGDTRPADSAEPEVPDATEAARAGQPAGKQHRNVKQRTATSPAPTGATAETPQPTAKTPEPTAKTPEATTKTPEATAKTARITAKTTAKASGGATKTSRAAAAKTPKPAAPVADAGEAGGSDVWRRVGAVVIVIVAAFAVVVLWARPAHEPAPPVAQRSSAPPAVTVLNPTDIAYLQLMISLDTSAGQLFDLIVAGGDPALVPIARSAADGHRAELAALRKALTDGGAIEDSSIHAGHDLPGMVVEADMAAIRALPAAQQPAKALEVLREHLTGTTALCGSEAKNGADPATKAAAEQVLAAHSKLLGQLPAM
ncbi:hypothetical protein AB0K00_27860 [Dactylosporangium sp. NPDC049525]|uniref:hypothetical protein n=1 Tax=Dactylosporangium sp. NPDC049525 TaxID=3154730 RepID=UPI00341A0B6A